MLRPASYVLVTPARNEQATIEITIQSVVGQTILPREWIIVSDASTDRTDSIVQRYAVSFPFIRLLRLEQRQMPGFASVVFATETGIKALCTADYDFLGLLDSDVRFAPDYFAQLIGRFHANSRLGLAGGLVLDVNERTAAAKTSYLRDVAGAVHFFRAECFRSLGGLIPIPEGGWDAITNVQARAQGYDTQTFPDLVVDHLKPRNISQGGAIRRKWQLGVRDYAIGYDPVFELGKCLCRWHEQPLLISSCARLIGFLSAFLARRPRVLSRELVAMVHREQWSRILRRDRSFRQSGKPVESSAAGSRSR
jgi:poly-beta-1,6-N-acetyl-D-glucosamine synthase